MEKLFLSILNMSLTASFVIAAIILVRIPLKKAPKVMSYALWAVVGFRLVFPFTIESAFSLLPFKSTPIPQDIAMQAVPKIDSGIPMIENAVSVSLPAAVPYASVNPLQIWLFIGSCVWLLGVAVMLAYSFASIILLKHRLKSATRIESNIYEAANLKTPFVIGLLTPKIYMPTGLTDEEFRYILLHEKTHIGRHDHAIKMLAYLILCLHWFNPMVWAAFILMSADMEMSCDERVMKELGGDIKNAYSLSLVRVAVGRRILNGSPLAFGEGGMKERVKNVLNFRKPSRVIVVAAVALVAVLSVGFAMNRSVKTIVPDIAFGTFALESPTERQNLERMTSFTLYDDGTALFNQALISSYIPPKCTFAVEDNELIFRAIIETEHDRVFFGLENDALVARFSVIDRSTVSFTSSEIALFAEPGGQYVHIPNIVSEPFTVSDLYKLSELRTTYVGDNSAVGKIIGYLPELDEDQKQQFFSIGDDYGTGRTPYTLTLYYEPSDAEADESKINTKNLTLAPKNAALMLSLIDNLEEITYAFRKTVSSGELDKAEYTSSVRLDRNDVTAYLESMGLSWEDFQDDWNGSVKALYASSIVDAQPTSVTGEISPSENASNFIDLGTEPGMVSEPAIVDGSVIRIVDFESGDSCTLYIEVLAPTGLIDENSGAGKYEVVRNTKLLLPADVLVNYIDYESSTGTNGKKLINYLKQGGSYFTEPTIAKLLVQTNKDGDNISMLTEIYEP